MTYKELNDLLSTKTPTEQFVWLEAEVKRLGLEIADKNHADWITKGEQDPFNGYYDDDDRPAQSNRCDYVMANAVFMAGRMDLGLIAQQTEAKERILWLSRQLYKHRLIQAILLAE